MKGKDAAKPVFNQFFCYQKIIHRNFNKIVLFLSHLENVKDATKEILH